MNHIKTSKCRYCKQSFVRVRPDAIVCSEDCAIGFAEKKREKVVREGVRLQRERMKTRRQWMNEAQFAFNKFIRTRDHALPCISCGRHADRYDAGHYRSRGAHPELAFEPDNCHKQCSRPCNKDLGGNIVEYRMALLEKIGPERLAWIEGPHEPKKYTIEELREMKAKYSLMAKQLKEAT